MKAIPSRTRAAPRPRASNRRWSRAPGLRVRDQDQAGHHGGAELLPNTGSVSTGSASASTVRTRSRSAPCAGWPGPGPRGGGARPPLRPTARRAGEEHVAERRRQHHQRGGGGDRDRVVAGLGGPRVRVQQEDVEAIDQDRRRVGGVALIPNASAGAPGRTRSSRARPPSRARSAGPRPARRGPLRPSRRQSRRRPLQVQRRPRTATPTT